jgi:hypothetical protein
MADAPLQILVIDDDADTRANFRDILGLDGYRVESADSISRALARSDWAGFSAVILDRRLPEGMAEDFLPQLKERAPEAAIIIVTGYADLHGAIAALRQGATDYILKPVNPEVLRASLLRVAERRRLALAKERSEAAFRSLVEAAPCMIVIFRADALLLYFSPFAEQLTGYRSAEVLGQNYLALFMPDDATRQAIQDNVEHIVQGGRPTRGLQSPIVCKDGTCRWMIWNAQLLPDYEGAPAILAVGQDITSIKESQERALQAERLAAIGQMVAGLAHESGNAMARSQACLEMLALEVEDRPEALELVSRIQKAQDHLRQLYDEVRGYAAPLKLEREVWDVAAIWRQAWENLRVLREQRDARLLEAVDSVDPRCRVDPFRLEQVFRNMLENALAACKDPVRIEVRCSETSLNGKPALQVAIRDNGPGLNAEQRQRIFDPFYTTKTKGTGLGMAIAKRIVEAHGGQIAVGAGAGAGAELVIVLPRDNP